MNDKRVQEEIDREELNILNVSEDYMEETHMEMKMIINI